MQIKADLISVVHNNYSNSPYLTIYPTNKKDGKVTWLASQIIAVRWGGKVKIWRFYWEDKILMFLFNACLLPWRRDNESFCYQRYFSSFPPVSFELFCQPAAIANLQSLFHGSSNNRAWTFRFFKQLLPSVSFPCLQLWPK